MERKILIFIVIASYRYDILYEQYPNKYVTFAREFRHTREVCVCVCLCCIL